MNKSIKLSTLTAALMGLGLVSGSSQAQVFFGGTVGRSNIGNYDFEPGDVSQQQDGSDTAYRVFLGYQWNKYLATTIGYADLGSLNASGQYDGGEGGTISFKDKVSATSMDISAIGILPFSMFAGEDSFFGRFSLFGQVGLAFYNQKENCTACVFDGSTVSDFKGGDSGTGVLLGGGLNVRITDSLDVHVHYLSYPQMGNTDLAQDTGQKQAWDFWGIGATWSIK